MKLYDLTEAYKDDYQMAILAVAENRKEKVIAVNEKTFEEVKGKEIMLRLTTEILEEMEKEIE